MLASFGQGFSFHYHFDITVSFGKKILIHSMKSACKQRGQDEMQQKMRKNRLCFMCILSTFQYGVNCKGAVFTRNKICCEVKLLYGPLWTTNIIMWTLNITMWIQQNNVDPQIAIFFQWSPWNSTALKLRKTAQSSSVQQNFCCLREQLFPIAPAYTDILTNYHHLSCIVVYLNIITSGYAC